MTERKDPFLRHSEVLTCVRESLVNENGHYRFTHTQITEIVEAYLRSLLYAMGTGHRVQMKLFGTMQFKVYRARNMKCRNNLYIRKCPFNIRVKVELSVKGRAVAQQSLMQFNNFIDGELSKKGLSE